MGTTCRLCHRPLTQGNAQKCSILMCYRTYMSQTALTATAEQCLATVENPQLVEQNDRVQYRFPGNKLSINNFWLPYGKIWYIKDNMAFLINGCYANMNVCHISTNDNSSAHNSGSLWVTLDMYTCKELMSNETTQRQATTLEWACYKTMCMVGTCKWCTTCCKGSQANAHIIRSDMKSSNESCEVFNETWVSTGFKRPWCLYNLVTTEFFLAMSALVFS